MPASKKQIKANRKNAQKSTGPKTADGKAIAARNAVNHGLYSQNILIDAPRLKEDPAEFKTLLDQLYTELEPKTIFQEHLVRKIALCLWRSRRAVIAETAEINDQIRDIDSSWETRRLISKFLDCNDDDEDDESPEDRERFFANEAVRRSLPSNSRDIMHYEMRLDRQMFRSYRLLELLQLRDRLHEISDDPVSNTVTAIGTVASDQTPEIGNSSSCIKQDASSEQTEGQKTPLPLDNNPDIGNGVFTVEPDTSLGQTEGQKTLLRPNLLQK
ncbi:MAG: hypothetical protein AB1746_15135 [Candidatus Zixiibacteriota bacterium]